jgi:hypothetical protein
MQDLQRALDRAQPAATNFWAHAQVVGHMPCLDAEKARNQSLKQMLREEREAKSKAAEDAEQRKRHPVYPPREPKKPLPPPPASAASAVNTNTGNGASSAAVVVVPAYIPLHANPNTVSGSDMRLQRAGGGGGATATTTTALSNSSKRLTKPRLACTPTEIDFGTIMEGFRYSTVVQLTNVAAVSTRFRVLVATAAAHSSSMGSPTSSTKELKHSIRSATTSCPWLSVEFPKLALAPGMSCAVELELDGHQPLGVTAVTLAVVYEGGETVVPVTASTRSGQERPVSQQRSNVRMIGPSSLVYTPGATATRSAAGSTSYAPPEQNNGYDSD